jgi:peroxidase
MQKLYKRERYLKFMLKQIDLRKTVAGFFLCTAVAAMANDPQALGIPFVSPLKEYRPIGAGGNNVAHPWLDPRPGTPEVALTPLNFADENDTPVNGPNPRTLSNVISGGAGANGQDSQTTDPVASAWVYVFGQFLDHDIDLEATPLTNAAYDIYVPAESNPTFTNGSPNPFYQKSGSIGMNRSTRNRWTNTIINTTAGYLDLSQLYGSDAATAASLRNADGSLKTSPDGTALPIVNGAFVTGDPRVMENPELTAATILFLREHNFWVGILKSQHPNWSGGQLYHMAKAINTAEYQNIVYKEFLPVLIGPVLDGYRGYNPNVNAQATQEFSTAAFRVGHSQISGTQEGIDNTGAVVFTENLAAAFFNTPAKDISNGINPLLRNLGTDFSQATDVYAIPELRDLLVAGLVGGGVDLIDLIAIDIQRQRDVGLGTLNQTRRALKMSPYHQISDLTTDPVLQGQLQSLYTTPSPTSKTLPKPAIDNIDLFIGGLAEKHAARALVGQTFQAIIKDQFEALRAGDRFFWLNEGFDQATASMIANTTLATLIKRNAATPNLQANVFLQADLPPHVRHHSTMPGVINPGGTRRQPFAADGT